MKKLFLSMFCCMIFYCTAFAQNGCYITDANGARVFFIAHPDGNALHFSSTGSNTNYIVLNTGSYNCTNYNGSTFATNTGALGPSCEVRDGSSLTFTGNLITSYQTYQCSIDDYLWVLIALLSGLAFPFIKKTSLCNTMS